MHYFFVYAQRAYLRMTHKKCAKLQKKNEMRKKIIEKLAYLQIL